MSNKKWKYNENYFEKIDSNEKAYWFGFITADGYIQNNRMRENKSESVGLRIRLTESDKEHLEKLNKSINSNKPIKIVKNYGVYNNCKNLAEFYLTSIKIVKDLNALGLSCGNKSCNEKFPSLLNNDFTKNFILGLFDGDGSISYHNSFSKKDNKYRKLYEYQIVSSKGMIISINDFLIKEIPDLKIQKISKNNNKSNNDLYRLRIGSKNSIKKLYEYFYINNDNNVYLERKYNTMKEIYEN